MKHQFVEFVPYALEPETVYVSIEHDIAIHLCACGCKNQVVTPLSPAGWSLTYDGLSISLSPSIGNWNFECKSHYFIRKGRIDWSRKFSRDEIEWVQDRDAKERARLYDKDDIASIVTAIDVKESKGFWGWWLSLLR